MSGHLAEAYRLLESTQRPSWLYAVTSGATTIWERWDSLLPDGTVYPGNMTSFNHYALGAVADWLHRVVAGIECVEPGWRAIRFAPQPGGTITHASARHVTPYGDAAISWVIDGARLTVSVTVPVGSRAVVALPGSDEVHVGHGDHEFTVAWASSTSGWPEAAIGEGTPVVVLVPSLGTTNLLFADLSRELGRRFPEAEVIRTDLPGHGSGPRAESTSVESLADDVAEKPRVLRTPVALSWSGSPWEVLSRLRSRVGIRRWFLDSCRSTAVFDSAPQRAGKILISSVEHHGTAQLVSASAAGWFSDAFRDSPTARGLLSEIAAIDDESYIACCNALAVYDGDHDLRDVEVPALLIGTADDHGTPSAAMREVAAALPAAEFVELPAGAHLSLAEHPVDTVDIIANWISRNLS